MKNNNPDNVLSIFNDTRFILSLYSDVLKSCQNNYSLYMNVLKEKKGNMLLHDSQKFHHKKKD